MEWKPYDPSWLVELAKLEKPDQPWLATALSKCIQAQHQCPSYITFVDTSNPNKPGSEWQFKTNIILESPVEGTVVLDLLKDGRIGGAEFLARLCEDEDHERSLKTQK